MSGCAGVPDDNKTVQPRNLNKTCSAFLSTKTKVAQNHIKKSGSQLLAFYREFTGKIGRFSGKSVKAFYCGDGNCNG